LLSEQSCVVYYSGNILTDSLPAFIHVFAFSLLTILVVPAFSAKTLFRVCFFWTALNLVFEAGQMFGDEITHILPSFFSHYLWIENLGPYFSRGTFDSSDMLSAFLGGVAAYYHARGLLR
jgi:hypothetical protein